MITEITEIAVLTATAARADDLGDCFRGSPAFARWIDSVKPFWPPARPSTTRRAGHGSQAMSWSKMAGSPSSFRASMETRP